MSTRSGTDEGFAPPTETTPQPHTDGERESNVGTTAEESGKEAQGQRTFGSLTPQEAGRRSAQARRERALAHEAEVTAASNGRVELVRTPVEVGAIIARLQIDAKKGSTQAARELREWMTRYPAEDATDMSALDSRTRQQVLARVLADIEAEEGAGPSGPLG